MGNKTLLNFIKYMPEALVRTFPLCKFDVYVPAVTSHSRKDATPSWCWPANVNGTMGICIWKRQSIITMVLVVVLLLVLLGQTVCKTHYITCPMNSDPLPIFHKFYQPGDFIIGQIVAHIFLFHNSPLFLEHPKELLNREPM